MVNTCVGPVQPLATGVTVIVAVTGAAPELVAVNDGMFPLPEAARPMPALSLVQLNVVPPTAPEKLTAAVVAPLHKVWSAGSTTFGVGCTVMVNVCAGPVHPLAAGITVMVAVMVDVPLLVAVKAGMSPVPDAARPMEGVLFVHAYVVPATAPVKTTAVVVDPLQRV